MKNQGGETVKLTEVLYITNYVKNLLIVSRAVSKGATMVVTQYKTTTQNNGVSMVLDTSKRGKIL